MNTNNVSPRLRANRFYKIYAQRFMLGFLYFDVKPAIRARRKNPQNDVISYLISRNYDDVEILMECIVYGVAGMATTREFILTAVWHLLEKPHLRQRMQVGSPEERRKICALRAKARPILSPQAHS